MDDKIIIDRMDAEEFLSMLMDAAKQDNPTVTTVPPRSSKTLPTTSKASANCKSRLAYRRDGEKGNGYDLS